MFRKTRHFIGLFIILIAIIMLIWGERRFPRQIKSIQITPEEFQELNISDDDAIIPGVKFTQMPILEEISKITMSTSESSGSSSYRLMLDAPTRIRTGDADYILLKISPDGLHGSAQSAPVGEEENQNKASAGIYSTYNLLAESRLELDGALFEPTGDIIASFQPDQPLSFYWTVQPEKSGAYNGIVWLHFQYVAKDESQTLRKLISRQSIEMTSESLAGLRGDVARFTGGIGFFVGLALDIDLWVAIYLIFKERQRK